MSICSFSWLRFPGFLVSKQMLRKVDRCRSPRSTSVEIAEFCPNPAELGGNFVDSRGMCPDISLILGDFDRHQRRLGIGCPVWARSAGFGSNFAAFGVSLGTGGKGWGGVKRQGGRPWPRALHAPGGGAGGVSVAHVGGRGARARTRAGGQDRPPHLDEKRRGPAFGRGFVPCRPLAASHHKSAPRGGMGACALVWRGVARPSHGPPRLGRQPLLLRAQCCRVRFEGVRPAPPARGPDTALGASPRSTRRCAA